jgi:MOSC domain-containing protein YiiM
MIVTLDETRLGQPEVIGRNRDGSHRWSSINRKRTGADNLFLTWTGLEGDKVTEDRPKTADEGGVGQIHGGNDKAVYVYSSKHYPLWVAELGEAGLAGRSLGENWRVDVTETDVHIGDRWALGDALLEVSRVRTPCTTLVAYFGGQQMIKRMTANGLCGWYMQVIRPGLVPTRGAIEVVSQNLSGPTVALAFAAKMNKRGAAQLSNV